MKNNIHIALGTSLALSANTFAQTETEVIDLDAFVVTGTRTERLLSEAPVKTELLTSEDLSEYNVSSFKDALKLIPSARFENDCQNCGLNQIQLLGLSTDYTAILFDGAPLYSGLAKVYGADLFPAVFIDRIEVVKGGSSVLYGPEAMAGVINLITEEPIESGIEVIAGFESILGDATNWEASARGDYVDPNGTYSITGYAYFQDREGLDLTTDGFSEIPEFESSVVGAQAWIHPNSGSDLKFNYQYMDQEHRGGDQLDQPEERAEVAESLAHEIHLAQVSWSQKVSPDFNYSLGASMLGITRESFYGARADNAQRAYENAGFSGDVTEAWIANNATAIDATARTIWGLTDNKVYYLESQFNNTIGDHTLSYGVQYRYEELTDGSLFEPAIIPTTEDSFGNLSAFVQDQWEISEKLEVVPGIRVDEHDNVDDTIFSPRLAARYFANDELTLRASWSTGFNAPGAFNEDQHIGVTNGGAIFLFNSDGLKEESSQTFSFGGEFTPTAYEGDVIIHSQVHYTMLEDTFEIDDSGDVSGDPDTWLRVNGPDSEIFVWENNVNWQINDNWSIDSGLSYIHARFDETIDRVTGLSTDEFIERPEWTSHLGINYDNEDLFDAHALLTYTGEMLAVGEDADIWRETDPFYVIDLGISKEFHDVFGAQHLIIAAGIENILDDRQDDLLDTGADRDPTYFYGPSQPRIYYIRLTAVW
ncbi:MAG: TonB-dependent receptor plug domain-containing protein [Opitutales bacterium]